MAVASGDPTDPSYPGTTTTTTERTSSGGLVGRILLTLLGAAGMAGSAFLNWVGDGDVGLEGRELPVDILWTNPERLEIPTFISSVGFVFLVLAAVAVIGLIPRSGWLTVLAGLAGVAAFVLFVVTLYRANGRVNDLGVGAWAALAGGLLALVGGLMGRRRRQEVVRTAGPPVAPPPPAAP